MSDILQQAEALEEELLTLTAADELDDERLGGVLIRRDALHRELGSAIEAEPELLAQYQPFLRQAYKNTEQLQKRCEHEREEVKQKLLTLNTSKKARKAY